MKTRVIITEAIFAIAESNASLIVVLEVDGILIEDGGVDLPNARIIPIPDILFIGFKVFPRFRIDSTSAGLGDGKL